MPPVHRSLRERLSRRDGGSRQRESEGHQQRRLDLLHATVQEGGLQVIGDGLSGERVFRGRRDEPLNGKAVVFPKALKRFA